MSLTPNRLDSEKLEIGESVRSLSNKSNIPTTSNKINLNQTVNSATDGKLEKNDREAIVAGSINGNKGNEKGVKDGSFVSGIGGRKIIFRPNPPKVNIEDSNPVIFKIKILPFGTVSQVLPMQKGNPMLEKVGIQYLKQFKFEAINSQIIQEGFVELKINRGRLSGN